MKNFLSGESAAHMTTDMFKESAASGTDMFKESSAPMSAMYQESAAPMLSMHQESAVPEPEGKFQSMHHRLITEIIV